MKKTNLGWMAVSFIIVLLVVLATCSGSHKCIDPSHVKCDGQCECDGFECK